MNKKNRLLCVSCLLIAVLFSSCENFLNGGDLKSNLDNALAYANAKICRIRLDSDAGNWLTGSPVECKVGYETTVEYKLKGADDVFTVESFKVINWNTKAEVNDCIDFIDISEKDKIYTVKIKLLKESENLAIIPNLKSIPYITSVYPEYTGSGVYLNTEVRFELSEAAKSISFDSVSIKDSNGNSINNLFETPRLSDGGKAIVLNLDIDKVKNSELYKQRDVFDISVSVKNLVTPNGEIFIVNENNEKKFRFNKNVETGKPIINEFHAAKNNDDLNNNVFLGEVLVDGMSEDTDYLKNYVGYSFYFDIDAVDGESGVRNVVVTETITNEINGTPININGDYVEKTVYSSEDFSFNKNGEIKFAGKHMMKCKEEGAVKVTVSVTDYAGNVCENVKEFTVFNAKADLDSLTWFNGPYVKKNGKIIGGVEFLQEYARGRGQYNMYSIYGNSTLRYASNTNLLVVAPKANAKAGYYTEFNIPKFNESLKKVFLVCNKNFYKNVTIPLDINSVDLKFEYGTSKSSLTKVDFNTVSLKENLFETNPLRSDSIADDETIPCIILDDVEKVEGLYGKFTYINSEGGIEVKEIQFPGKAIYYGTKDTGTENIYNTMTSGGSDIKAYQKSLTFTSSSKMNRAFYFFKALESDDYIPYPEKNYLTPDPNKIDVNPESERYYKNFMCLGEEVDTKTATHMAPLIWHQELYYASAKWNKESQYSFFNGYRIVLENDGFLSETNDYFDYSNKYTSMNIGSSAFPEKSCNDLIIKNAEMETFGKNSGKAIVKVQLSSVPELYTLYNKLFVISNSNTENCYPIDENMLVSYDLHLSGVKISNSDIYDILTVYGSSIENGKEVITKIKMLTIYLNSLISDAASMDTIPPAITTSSGPYLYKTSELFTVSDKTTLDSGLDYIEWWTDYDPTVRKEVIDSANAKKDYKFIPVNADFPYDLKHIIFYVRAYDKKGNSSSTYVKKQYFHLLPHTYDTATGKVSLKISTPFEAADYHKGITSGKTWVDLMCSYMKYGGLVRKYLKSSQPISYNADSKYYSTNAVDTLFVDNNNKANIDASDSDWSGWFGFDSSRCRVYYNNNSDYCTINSSTVPVPVSFAYYKERPYSTMHDYMENNGRLMIQSDQPVLVLYYQTDLPYELVKDWDYDMWEMSIKYKDAEVLKFDSNNALRIYTIDEDKIDSGKNYVVFVRFASDTKKYDYCSGVRHKNN